MADDFALQLAERIQSHPKFCGRYLQLQVAGVRSTIGGLLPSAEEDHADTQRRASRLLFSTHLSSVKQPTSAIRAWPKLSL